MATLTLKSLPDDLHARLKERAARNRRSLNREAIACLEDALSVRSVGAAEVLESARLLRRDVGGWLTESELAPLRSAGRS